MKTTNLEQRLTHPIIVVVLSLLCTILWGSAFPSIKIGYQLFSLQNNDVSGTLVFAGIRFFLAGIIVILIHTVQHKKLVLPSKNNMKGILWVSLFQTILEYIFFYVSMAHTTGVKGSIIDAAGFFFVVILAHYFYKNDKFTLNKLIGCLLGFSGIIIININGLSLADISFHPIGDGFMLLAALFFAIGSIISKNVCRNADAILVTGYQLGIGGLVLLLLGLFLGGRLNTITVSGLFLLLYMALLSAISFSLWTALSKYNKISKIAVYNFLTPIFGALLSSLFLGDRLFTWYNLIALIFVCMGIFIVNLVKKDFTANVK